jgi:hypothetical protein
MNASDLHVIAVISNPVRYQSRYKLFKRFEKMVQDSGAILHVVEAAFGERPPAITSFDSPRHYIFRTQDELWHKENMWNIALPRLPHDFKYVACVDADTRFARPDWAEETVHQLQHYEVVQMWSEAHDLTPDFNIYQKHLGFVYCELHGYPKVQMTYGSGSSKLQASYGSGSSKRLYWHPGYAWAYTRKAIDTFGGLLDTAILGAADRHMAHALFGTAEESLHSGLTPGYKKAVMEWQERAAYLHQDVGYVPGAILHDFHGKKKDRKYADRWQILIDNKFDPYSDLTRDYQGLWQLRPERIGLRNQIREYFRGRNEDSIDLE